MKSLHYAFTIFLISGCQSLPNVDSEPLFVVNKDSITFENTSRRKWDSPVLGDFDQDGLVDIAVTDHGYAVTIFWNEGDRFSEPQRLIGGDTHGVAVGDPDQNGKIDILVSQGGGGGTNPRFPVRFEVNSDRSVESHGTFDHFERSRGRAIKLIDNNQDGVPEMYTTAFPLKLQTKGANFLYEPDEKLDWRFARHLPYAKWLGYKTAVVDINNDGLTELFFYGGDNIVVSSTLDGQDYVDISKAVLRDLRDTSHVSSITPIDFDNDGDFDLLLTRAEHQFTGHTYYNAEGNRFAFFARGNAMEYGVFEIEGDFILDNLQMAYPHYDVFVGARATPLDIETPDRNAGRDLRVRPDQAVGFPTDTSSPGLYIGYLGDGKWKIGGKTRSPTAGVIRNVISKHESTDHKALPVKLFQNTNGVFTDVTEALGIDVSEQTTNAVVADINNDSWQDFVLFPAGDSSKFTSAVVYLGSQGDEFNRLDEHGVVSDILGSTGGYAVAFDFDQDNDVDIVYGEQRGQWRLYENTTSASRGIGFDISPYITHIRSAQNAVVELHACGRAQRRMVGSTSAAFSQSLNPIVHFGLGDCPKVDRVNIYWTDGSKTIVPHDQIQIP